MKIKLKKNTNNDKSDFWKDLKEILRNIIAGDISDEAKLTLIIFTICFIAVIGVVIYNLCFFVPSFKDFMTNTFKPITNFILYFWTLYRKIWECFGFDTSSEKNQRIITEGVIYFFCLLFTIIVPSYENNKDRYETDLKYRKFYNISLTILFLILLIMLSFILVSCNDI